MSEKIPIFFLVQAAVLSGSEIDSHSDPEYTLPSSVSDSDDNWTLSTVRKRAYRVKKWKQKETQQHKSLLQLKTKREKKSGKNQKENRPGRSESEDDLPLISLCQKVPTSLSPSLLHQPLKAQQVVDLEDQATGDASFVSLPGSTPMSSTIPGNEICLSGKDVNFAVPLEAEPRYLANPKDQLKFSEPESSIIIPLPDIADIANLGIAGV